jgi:Calcineurin-like phosphoesterase
MRIAAIYDIHANLPALEAVIGKIRQEEVDGVVVGGDVLPGPMPLETLERLQDLDVTHSLDSRAARSGTPAISGGVAQNSLPQFAEIRRSALLPRDTSKRE